MSQKVGIVREVNCMYISVLLISEPWICWHSSACVAARDDGDSSAGRFGWLALNVVTQNYGDFIYIILLRRDNHKFSIICAGSKDKISGLLLFSKFLCLVQFTKQVGDVQLYAFEEEAPTGVLLQQDPELALAFSYCTIGNSWIV